MEMKKAVINFGNRRRRGDVNCGREVETIKHMLKNCGGESFDLCLVLFPICKYIKRYRLIDSYMDG